MELPGTRIMDKYGMDSQLSSILSYPGRIMELHGTLTLEPCSPTQERMMELHGPHK